MRLLKKALLTGASLLGIATARAAEISWSSNQYTNTGSPLLDVLGVDQFALSGTLIQAQNSGGGVEILGGIRFDAGTLSMDDGGVSTFYPKNLPANNVGHTGTYSSSGAFTITLGGVNSVDVIAADGIGGYLVIGDSYRFQALILDTRGQSGVIGRTVKFDGFDQGVYANGLDQVTYGHGLLVTGVFVADSTTQSFTIENFNGVSSVGGQINAFTLSNISEKSSAALLSLSGITIILR